MGLDSANENVIATVRRQQRVDLGNEGAETGLFKDFGVGSGGGGDGGRAVPEPFGVLLGHDCRHPKDLRQFERSGAVGNNAVGVEDGREQLVLDIDHKKRGSFERKAGDRHARRLAWASSARGTSRTNQ